jgi:hypothetical protein
MTRRLQLPPSGWREARSLLIGETKRWWIMRRRLRLTVRVVAGLDTAITGLFRVEAFVSNAERPARMVYCGVVPTALEARIDEAKRWAESEADRLAMSAGQSLRNRRQCPVDICAGSGRSEGL